MHRKSRVLIVLPFEETTDGTGGAVGHWISQYVRWNKMSKAPLDVVVLEARNIPDGLAPHAKIAWFLLKILRYFALHSPRIIAKVIKKLINLLKLWDYLVSKYILSSDIDLVIIQNRPELLKNILQNLTNSYGNLTSGSSNRALNFILHMHNDMPTYISSSSLHFIMQMCHRCMVVFCSGYIRQRALDFYDDLSFDNTYIVHNGVSASPTPLQNQCKAKKHVITFAGRLIPEKGPDNAIRICKLLSELMPEHDFSLNIVGGSTSNRSDRCTKFTNTLFELGRSAHSKNLSVTFLGSLPHDSLMSALNISDLFLYPCRWQEPFGMVVLEALSTGNVVVASRAGGIPEIVTNNVNGVLLPPVVSAEVWAERIQKLLLNQSEFMRLQRQAKESSSAFTWQRIFDRYQTILLMAIGI